MVSEYVVNWSGARIGTGATVWHFTNVNDSPAANQVADVVREWYGDVSDIVPDDVTFTFSSEMRILDTVSGDLEGIATVAGLDPVIGQSGGAFANGTGLLVRKRTAGIAGNRRLQGRVYLVPVISACFLTNGDVDPGVITGQQGQHDALLSGLEAVGNPMVVWSRTAGLISPVTTMVTASRPQGLRTRNDR